MKCCTETSKDPLIYIRYGHYLGYLELTGLRRSPGKVQKLRPSGFATHVAKRQETAAMGKDPRKKLLAALELVAGCRVKFISVITKAIWKGGMFLIPKGH